MPDPSPPPSPPGQPAPQEVELKLEIASADPADARARLEALLNPLAQGAPHTQSLLNIYYDTPDQALARAAVALRLRRLPGAGGQPDVWLQTLKTAGHDAAGLSRRGEWEQRVAGPQLDDAALAGTPWQALNPAGDWFGQLQACFTTRAQRTRWLIAPDADTRIEVALDTGDIRAGDAQTPIHELELELLQGHSAALFALAGQLAALLPLLPAHTSKAERGWRLAQGTLHQPRRAQPVRLGASLPIARAAHHVLAEALNQFCANLVAVLHSDQPESVHQARVGWRRFRSGWWLFRRVLADAPPPPLHALRPLRAALGHMRDLDVMALETLPPWAQPYIAHEPRRAGQWHALESQIAQARQRQRAVLLQALRTPATGAALLALAAWVERLHSHPPEKLYGVDRDRIGAWARQRTRRLHQRLDDERRSAASQPHDANAQHAVRLLAKRTRYGIEALHTLLPARKADRWRTEASALQTDIGLARDLCNLIDLLRRLDASAEIIAFMRGVIAGRATSGS